MATSFNENRLLDFPLFHIYYVQLKELFVIHVVEHHDRLFHVHDHVVIDAIIFVAVKKKNKEKGKQKYIWKEKQFLGEKYEKNRNLVGRISWWTSHYWMMW